MTVQVKPDSTAKAAVSVSSQCRLLKMSRSQFYWHVKRGTFHSPLYLATNNRPYFTAAMVADNVRARETAVGVNGEYVIFYERQAAGTKAERGKPRSRHSGLLEGLKASDLKDVTGEMVDAALDACFPNGTAGQDEANVLRAVYRHLKRAVAG